jgi:hypothetical protein
MKQITVELAGKEYAISPLPIRKAREWRKQFEEIIADISELLSTVGEYVDVEFENTQAMVSTIGSLVSGNLSKVAGYLLGSADIMAEAIFTYSDELAKDRERIEDEAFDDELVQVFLAILKLAFPFGGAVEGLIKLGQEPPETPQSSASVSSENGMTS